MKLLGIGVVVALCATLSHQTAMNDATKAIFEVRERLRHTNMLEVMKNVSEIVGSALPQNMLPHAPPDALRNIAVHLIKNITSPNNIRTFLRLVKESKMKKKGEIIRLTMRFMNPENLRPEGLIHTFQSLDDLTVSELSGIFLEYIKEIAPQFLGTYYEHFDFIFKYINPNDFKEITRIFFDIFRETEADDILWFVERVKEELNEVLSKTREIVTSEGESLLNGYKTKGIQEIQEVIKALIRDSKKIAHFEKLSPHIVELTKAFKMALSHVVGLFITDLKTHIGHIDMKKLQGGGAILKNITHVATALADFIDFDELGADAENLVIYLKKLNRDTAKSHFAELRKLLPTADDVIEFVTHSELPAAKMINKEFLANILRKLNATKIPDSVFDSHVDFFLTAIQFVNEKYLKFIIDFIVQESQVDNHIYTTFKQIAFNVIFEQLRRLAPRDFRAENWDELKKSATNAIERFDEGLVQEVLREVLADIKQLDTVTIGDMLAESQTVVSTVLSHDLLRKAIEDPRRLIDIVNKTVFSELVSFQFNAVKLVNETQVLHWCRGFSNLAKDELNRRVDNASAWVLHQFDIVDNGRETAKLLKVNETTQIVGKFIKSIELSQSCDDIASVLRLNRVLGKEARKELINLLWSGFSRVQRAVNGDVIDQKSIQNLQEILNAVLRVLLRNNGNKADLRTGAVRLAIRSVDGYSKTGKIRLLMTKTESEELSERAVEQTLADEREMLEDAMLDTIVPFDIQQQRAWTEEPADVMFPKNTTVKTVSSIPLDHPTTKIPPTVEPKANETAPKNTDKLNEPKTLESTLPTTKEGIVATTEQPKMRLGPKVIMEANLTTKLSHDHPSAVPVTDLRKKASPCESHIHEVVEGAADNKPWARKMVDGWLQLGGANSVMSHTCLSVLHPKNHFTALYCQANISLSLNWPDKADPEEKFFVSGICLPSSCTPQQFSQTFEKIASQSLVHLSVLPETCHTQSADTEPQGAYTSRIILGVIVAVVLVATVFDLAAKTCFGKESTSQWLLSLSLAKNGQKCFETPPSESQFAVIYGIRGMGLIAVIAYCTLECVLSTGILSREEARTKTLLTVPMNLYAATDVMLFTGGALAAFVFRRESNRAGLYGVFANIAQVFFSMIYSIAGVILVRNGFFSTTETPACNNSWWHQLLFIENFMSQDKTCLPHGWYLSLEMQLFILTPIVLYLLSNPSKLKWSAIALGSAILIAVPLAILTSLNGPLVPFPNASDEQFVWDLIKPYTRMVPWLFGIIVGDIIQYQKSSEKRMKITAVKGLLGVVASSIVLVGLAIAAKYFYYSDRPHWQIALYLSLSRLLISGALAGFSLLCSSGSVGWISGIVSSGPFNVLGRLSLCAFLVHMTVVEMRMERSYSKYIDDYVLLIWFIGDYIMSQAAGIFLRLFLELPAKNITAIIYKNEKDNDTDLIIKNGPSKI